MNDVLKLINDELLAVADPEKAVGMKAYMKDNFEYLGVSAPERKVVVRFIWQQEKETILKQWRELFLALWEAPRREYQYVANDLMEKVKKNLKQDDIGLIEHFIIQKSWWDTVDFIAAHMAGKYFEKYPSQIKEIIPTWIESENMWLNRTAIIFQLKYKEKADFELMKRNILRHHESKEFFIKKASGWALRQHSKFDPIGVKDFLEEHPELSTLTKTEASKYL